MAEAREELILEINLSNSVTQISNLQGEIDALKKSQDLLNDSLKAGEITLEEYNKATVKNASAIRNTGAELKAQQRVLDGYNAAQKQSVNTSNLAANSIQTNRDLLKQLTAQYIQLKNPSANATAQIKHLSDVLKQQEAAIGNTSRNVGNYKEAFKGAFNDIAGGIPALKGFQTAQLGVNAAMNANPVGAVVLLLQSLYEIFKQNAAVADTVSFAIDGVTKAIGSVVDGIVDTVTNFDKFTEALRNPIKFLFNLGKNAANAAQEGFNAAKAIDGLSEASATANAIIGKNNVLIEKNVNILKTQTATIAERKKAAKEIADLERNNAQESIKIAQSELEAEQLKLKGKTLTGAQNAKLIELQGKLDAATLESQTVSEGYNRRISQLLQKEGQERNKLANEQESLIERQLKNEAALFIKQIDNDKKRDEERKKSEQARIDALNKQFNDDSGFLSRQLELDLKSVDLSVTTEEEKARRKEEIQINSLERQLDLAIQFLGADGSITREELQGIEAIKQAIESLRQSAAKRNEFGEGTLGSMLGFDKSGIDEISQGAQSAENIVKGVQSLISTASQARLNDIENEKNAEIQAVQESTASQEEKVIKIREIEARANKEKYEAEKAAFEANKVTSIILAVINTAQAIIAQLSNPTPYVGIVLAALAAATGAAQIAVISSQQPPPPPSKFAGGVIGANGPGTETSDSIDAKISRGESVMTAKATKMFHRELAQMELAVGNRPNYQFGQGMFAAGFIPSFNDGGFANRELSKGVDTSLSAQNMEEILKRLPSPKLSIVELESKQSSRNRSVKVSEA